MPRLPITSAPKPSVLAPRPSRSHLWKAVNRYYRSLYRQFYPSPPYQPRPVRRLRPVALLFFFSLFLFCSIFLSHRLRLALSQLSLFDRDAQHFRRLVHFYLRHQKGLASADLAPCPWLYLEVNAHDGRDLAAFFTDANGFFEEPLRAELSPSRAFCAVALEADDSHAPALLRVRQEKGLLARRFDVFPGVSALPIAQPDLDGVILSRLISDATLPLNESAGVGVGNDMLMAVANRHSGNVFVRISGSLRELYAHVDALESSGALCDRVDRLVLNVTAVTRDARQAARLPPPSGPRFSARQGVAGLAALVTEFEDRAAACRTRIFVTDEAGKMAAPLPISEKGVFYAVLAGAPTFNERISAQTASWLRGVPKDRVAIYTNVVRAVQELVGARGRPVVVVRPAKPDLERQLDLMQSWSHLVRVRETWDRFMKDDPAIKWLALVDDDTLVFPAGMREYLTMFDHRQATWGGSGELVRIDNGDHGEFAHWLRNMSITHGAKHCFMENEDVPERLRGAHNELRKSAVRNGKKTLKRVSHMCGDNFCKHGCPSVPQGAAIVMSRALVEKIRPQIEACEAATSTLCQRCGSQRLYMCVNRYLEGVRTLMTRGICRAPWKLEHRHNFPHALTYHAFTKTGKAGSMTGSIEGDMSQLWQLGADYESRPAWEGTIPMHEVADFLGCGGRSHYNKNTESCEPYEEADSVPELGLSENAMAR